MMKRPLKIVHLFVVASVRRERGTAGMYPVGKRRRAKALTLGFLLCLLGPAAHAQQASGGKPAQAKSTASGGRDEPACVEKVVEGSGKPQCISEKIESLRLGWAGRIARGFQYQYQLSEQTGSVLIGDPARIERNPEDYLQQHAFTFKFGELFPDRLTLFKRGAEYLKKNPQAASTYNELPESLCKGKPLVTCLAKGGSWWQRALMGTSVNLSLSERADVLLGFDVTDPQFGHDYQVHGGFVFDPAKLFPTATSWKSAFDEVQKVDKTLALVGAADIQPGKRRPWEQPLLAAIIPKVEFKVLSQFDFLKYQGTLIESPFRERALNTFTFTWDLTRAIPDTKSRADTDALDEALSELRSSLGREEDETAWLRRCVLHPSKEDGGLKDVREVKDLHPAFKAESCRELARFMRAGDYQLSCVKGKDKKTEERDDGSKVALSDDPALPPQNQCKWKNVTPRQSRGARGVLRSDGRENGGR